MQKTQNIRMRADKITNHDEKALTKIQQHVLPTNVFLEATYQTQSSLNYVIATGSSFRLHQNSISSQKLTWNSQRYASTDPQPLMRALEALSKPKHKVFTQLTPREKWTSQCLNNCNKMKSSLNFFKV